MFDHSDPVGTGVLSARGALGNYRQIVDAFFEFASNVPNTHFVRLERLPASADREMIVWPAFPISTGQTDEKIDNERWNWQDEYVEWRVVKEGGAITRIVFTTELPEYYEALAEVGADALIAGIQDAISGANPTLDELFGPGFNPQTATPAQRAERFRNRSVVPFSSPSNTVPPNPWNNGTKGILCLMQRFNTMGALFNLATRCAVPNPGIPAASQCASTGGACGPNRNSDPRICTRAQVVCRLPRFLTLADAVGIHIVKLNGNWTVGGAAVDINDPGTNQAAWTVDRNGRRGTLDLTKNLTLNGSAIAGGAQVSRFLDVGADVVSATQSNLLPAVAAGVAPARMLDALPNRTL